MILLVVPMSRAVAFDLAQFGNLFGFAKGCNLGRHNCQQGQNYPADLANPYTSNVIFLAAPRN